MRLTKRGPDANGLPTIQQLEALLRNAADFEPERDAPSDLVTRAFWKPPVCRRPNRAVFVAGVAGATALAALALILLLAHGQPTVAPVPAIDPGAPQIADGNNRKAVPKEETAPPDEEKEAVPQMEPDRPAIEPAVDYVSHRRHVRHHHRSVPKVRWQTETVRQYTSGVVTPAWLVQREDDSGDLVYTPVVMSVPVATGEAPVPAGGSKDSTFALVSNN